MTVQDVLVISREDISIEAGEASKIGNTLEINQHNYRTASLPVEVKELILRDLTSHELIEAVIRLIDQIQVNQIQSLALREILLDPVHLDELAAFISKVSPARVFRMENAKWDISFEQKRQLQERFCFPEENPLNVNDSNTLYRRNWDLFKAGRRLALTVGRFPQVSLVSSELGLVHNPFAGAKDVSFFTLMMSSLGNDTVFLDLSDNEICDSHIEHARPILGRFVPPSLLHLSLRSNKLTDVGLTYLLTGDVQYEEVFNDPQRTCFIDLSRNLITLSSAGVRNVLWNFLRRNPRARVDLSGNPLGCSVDGIEGVIFGDGFSQLTAAPIPTAGSLDDSSDSDFVEGSSSEDDSDSSDSGGALSLVSEGSDILNLLDEV
jgi:hypothetical protein